jgi:two-component system, NtrC family, response regulator HydG
MSNGALLVVDDDADMRTMLEAALTSRGHGVELAATLHEALDVLHDRDVDTVITDLKLDGESGLTVCRKSAELRPDVPVIVITAFGSMDSAVAAIRAGAYDFINKPIDLEALTLTVRRAVEHHRLKRELQRLKEGGARQGPLGKLLGDSPPMRRVYDLIERVADSDASILITGESGTGKELVARALHENSSRRTGPFVAVNCAAISATLLESELFGHVRGAFTDAKSDRTGLFVEANGGTLFLDEIGEMPLEMQSKLLRALQERKVRPVGGTREISFDTRIVAATNKDIDAAVERNEFREDLFYRINVVRIAVPPLRSRGNDILELAHGFLDKFAKQSNKRVEGFVSDAARKLLDYDWPGNVRELENVVERAVTLTRFDKITVEDLPERVREHKSDTFVVPAEDPEYLPTLDELEKRYIARVLKVVNGNKTAAAKVLGVDRRTLYRKLERYDDDTAQD